MMSVYCKKPYKVMSIDQIKLKHKNEKRLMNTSVHSPIRLFRAENILDLQTNLRDQFMHSYKDKVALSSEFVSPESQKNMDSPQMLNEKSPNNMRSNPRLGMGDSPIMSNSNLYNLNMQNKSGVTSNQNIKTLNDHTKLKRQGELEE